MDKGENPSWLSLRLIRWFCKRELIEELEGNLLEFHEGLIDTKFKGLRYWYQVMNYLRPSTLKSFKNLEFGPMFIINPLLTVRNLYRHLSTSIISLFGFTLGLVATIFLYFYIYSEVTTDSFHEDGDQIYRAVRMSEINGTPYDIGVTSAPYGEALINDYPSDVEDFLRVDPDQGLIKVGDKQFHEEDLIFTDGNFFQFFSFPLVSGSASSVLATANSVVITESIARKYFGDEDPIGKIIEYDNEYEFIVSGVAADLSAKSHINFDIVFSIALWEERDWFDGWWNNGLSTYVKIPTKEQADRLAGNLDQFMEKYMGDDFKEAGSKIGLKLEPLEDIYFNNETRYDYASHGNYASILTLGIVALAILFIACFNYVNLSIAQSYMRAKEVGVRKVLGGSKSRLVFQFLSESLMILLFSVLISIGLCELLNPMFNSSFGLEVDLNWLDSNVLLFFIGLFVIVLLSSGVYPALLLASFKSITTLKGSKLASGKNTSLRKVLVVTQFVISIFLIVISILVSVQTKYLNSKDLGFDRDAIVMVELNNREVRNERKMFKERLLENVNISGVTTVSGQPGGFHDASVLEVSGLADKYKVRTLFTDTDYFNVMDVEILSGRNFSSDVDDEEDFTAILNERAVHEMGLSNQEIIGRKFSMPGWDISDVRIVGVAADYHFQSLKDQIEPLVILSGGYQRKMLVKMNMQNIKDGLTHIDKVYSEIAPDYLVSYRFLDDSLKALYKKELKQAKVFSVFSILSIFLACLGIFGLASYAAQQRQKELGIRKVLGATSKQIIELISKEFILMVFIASVFALPASWFFMDQWLDSYAYRIDVFSYWPMFIAVGLVTIGIALATVTVKTYRAAISNPTDSIRNE